MWYFPHGILMQWKFYFKQLSLNLITGSLPSSGQNNPDSTIPETILKKELKV